MIFALFAFGYLLGFVGLLIAVPLATAIMMVLVAHGGTRASGGLLHDTAMRSMGLIVLAMGVPFALTGFHEFFHRTSWTAVKLRLLMGGLVALSRKVLDQSTQVLVFGNDQSKLLCVFERQIDMSCPAMKADECHQGITIARMPGEVLLEDGHCIFSLTGGMQRHSIDICVSRTLRLGFGRPSQFSNRLVASLETRQRESECMMQPSVPW